MIDFEGLLLFLSSAKDKAKKKSTWLKMIPRVRTESYPRSRRRSRDIGWPRHLGIEPTWRGGLGLGIGLGSVDLWFGWPKTEQLHRAGCGHK